ncbi:tetratricopeptide repeat protein [Flavobacterium sp.]|uniref:tetratricopeptide repeat-containing sensor histidine kinase n=1 Tax=Flavobacterium sp. TaxID=239 RepID=UPI0039E43916
MRGWFCLLLVGMVSAQNPQTKVDSLLNIIAKTQNDTVKARSYLLILSELRSSNPNKGLQYANEGLKIVQKLHWDKGFAAYYNDIGNTYHDRGNHLLALDYYLKSIAHSEKYTYLNATALQNAAVIYQKEHNFPMAIRYTNHALKIAVANRHDDIKANCWTTFGLIYSEAKQPNKAAFYFKKALAVWNAQHNDQKKAETLMDLGDVSKNLLARKNYYLQSKALWDSIDPGYLLAVSNLMGLAEININLASKENLRLKYTPQISRDTLLAQAEKYLNESIAYSKQSNVRQNLMFAYGKMSEVKSLQKDFETALRYNKRNYEIYTEIFSQDNKNKIAELEIRQKLRQKDSEIELNQLIIETNERQKWYLYIGLGLLGTIGILLFYQSYSRKKLNEHLHQLNDELDEANQIKARFFGILNHDLRSPVANLIDFLHLQKDSPDLLDTESKQRIEHSTINAAENLLGSMEDILLWSKGQMEHFSPQFDEVHAMDLFVYLQNHFAGFETVEMHFEDLQNVKIHTDEHYLKTILRNLTGNAIKALEGTENPKIDWKAWRDKKQVFLSVTDNGPGASDAQFKALYDDSEVGGIQSGLGLHLIRDLAKIIHCEISVESKPGTGTTFTLVFE